MHLARLGFVAAVHLAVLTACCGYNHGEIHSGVVDCAFTETALTWDDASATGTSPADTLGPYVGTWTATGTWASDGEPVDVSATVEPGDDDPVLATASDASCADQLRLPVRARVQTSGGELDLTTSAPWVYTFEAPNALQVGGSPDVAANAGSLDPADVVTPGDEPVAWHFAFTVDGNVAAGNVGVEETDARVDLLSF